VSYASTAFDHQEQWKGPVAVSAVLHAVFFLSVIGYSAWLGRPGESWGGADAGSAISATLVSNAAVPLPSNNTPKENVLATESKGLSQSEPKPVEETPEALPIPQQTKKVKPTPQPRTPTREVVRNTPPPTNVVPYGEGGPVSGQFSTFKTDAGTMGVNAGPGGTFGTQFSWYVDQMRRAIAQSWYTYDLGGAVGHRVYVTFDVLRDGTITNVQMEESSNIPALDRSAVQALQRVGQLQPLPGGYRGNKVSVEFYFEPKQ
jgi:protein TonB